ncbi:hypothetical protein F383_04074 [Gossypium arboreum]|uniref:Uncharacterized protein n=1 Tax=Gossypium arboreum TaxID=29729 RepID=A0A0B0PHU3_GOSAR|nr:hypothetical protein F383_04074 [Gossypium arboreum]
MCNHCIST